MGKTNTPDMGEIMRTRGGIFIRNSRIRSFAPEDENLGGGNETSSEPKFPANTPVKEMTPEQQAAYWQDKARKHEDRVKAFGDFTPEKLTQLQKERDDLRANSLSDADKAIEDAKEAGRAEIRTVLASERVKTAFEKALSGRIPDASALLELDRSKFIKDGSADTDAIKTWVENNSTEATAQKKHVDLGQGNRGGEGPAKGVSAGRELFSGSKKK